MNTKFIRKRTASFREVSTGVLPWVLLKLFRHFLIFLFMRVFIGATATGWDKQHSLITSINQSSSPAVFRESSSRRYTYKFDYVLQIFGSDDKQLHLARISKYAHLFPAKSKMQPLWSVQCWILLLHRLMTSKPWLMVAAEPAFYPCPIAQCDDCILPRVA